MPNFEHEDLMVQFRKPQPDEPSAERLARERQQVFHSYEPGSVQHGPEDSGPIGRQDVCVLDDRGGHIQLGVNCPHFVGFDPEKITQVDF